MADSLIYRDISGSITTAETDGNKTISFSFASETPHRRMDWESWEIIEEILLCEASAIVGTRLQDGLIPFLLNHSVNAQRGVIQEITWGNGKGRAIAKMSKNPAAEELYRDIKDEIVKGISVGYNVYEYETISEAVWEGKGYDIKLVRPKKVRATKWEIFEISAASIPADATVGVGRSLDAPIEYNLGRAIKNIGVNRVKKAIESMSDQTVDIRKSQEYLELDQKYRESQALLNTANTENEALRGQVAALQGEVQKHRFEADIATKYADLRAKADTLLQETKLQSHEYNKHFARNVSEILSEADPLTKLSALGMYLEMVGDRAPSLRTQGSVIPAEILEEPKPESKPNTKSKGAIAREEAWKN